MTSRNGSSIGYTSYNLPSVINGGSGTSSSLSYGAFRNRYKQVAVTPSGTETTIYVAGLLEKVTRGSQIEYRHYIAGGKGTAAIHTRVAGGASSTYCLHRDHLGSPELITDSSGNEVVRPSFAAYGERRDGADWSGPPSASDLTNIANITRRGFTGHEHLDSVGLIHMNGRVYEPIAGRFLGVDPILAMGNSQDVNSYSYAWNNPLRVIDPSGFCERVNGVWVDCLDDVPVRSRRRGGPPIGPPGGGSGQVESARQRDPCGQDSDAAFCEASERPETPEEQQQKPSNEPQPQEQKPTQCAFAPMFAGGNSFPIGDGYGPRVHPITGEIGRMHSGIDILAPQGTTWLSPIDGSVLLADFLSGNGGGTVVVLGRAGDSNYRVGGQHLSAIAVTFGQQVNRGDALATTGGRPGTLGAGGSTGPHLHFYVREAGKMIDPTACYTGAK